MADQHTVWRHGGRRTDHWRQVYTGSPTEAEVRFHQEKGQLRQGIVLVLAGDERPEGGDLYDRAVRSSTGKTLCASAPRLRTRW